MPDWKGIKVRQNVYPDKVVPVPVDSDGVRPAKVLRVRILSLDEIARVLVGPYTHLLTEGQKKRLEARRSRLEAR